MGYQLGIDLGTTYTAAAVCRASDRHWVEPEVVTLGTRTATVPSVLFVAPDGAVVVGEAAERRALTDPDRVVREFKRRIGDPTPVVVAGRAWAPEELSARLVRWVVDRVAEREGGPAARIAVTHPASWGAHKKELLAAALAGQGLAVTFLAEPQAAALHYAAAERVEPGSTIAVYDLGGGTFDAAVVRKDAGFGLLGRPEGLERLGGVDFDEVVFDHVRDGLPEAFEGLDEADAAVLAGVARVRRECTEAKEALSADTEVSVPVLLPGSRGAVRLHRSEFEQMIRPQVEETVAALRRAVASAGLTPEGLSAVLLVGGSSRIPLVAQLVSEQLGRPVAVDADPKNAIAKGAALAVSPKPTASWPEVSVAPVAAAAPAAAGMAGTALAAPPAVGAPEVTTPAPGFPAQHYPTTVGLWNASPRPPGALFEPAVPAERDTALLPPSGPQPGRPPMYHLPQPDWDYDNEPPAKRRPVGLLVGAGGALAAAAVLIAALTWPTSTSSTPTSEVSTGGSVATTRAEAPTVTPNLAPAPADAAGPVVARTGSGNGNRTSAGNASGHGGATVGPGTGGVPGGAVPAPVGGPPASTGAAAPAPAPVPGGTAPGAGAPQSGGAAPPASGGSTTPSGGAAPPANGGSTTPSGGATPPANGGTPPAGGGTTGSGSPPQAPSGGGNSAEGGSAATPVAAPPTASGGGSAISPA